MGVVNDEIEDRPLDRGQLPVGWPDESREAILEWRRRFRGVARRRQTIIARWERRSGDRAEPNKATPTKFATAVIQSGAPGIKAVLYVEAMLDVLSNAYDWLKLFEELADEFNELAGNSLPELRGSPPATLVSDAASGVIVLAELSRTLEKGLNPEE